jgi:hypothetical protein
VLDLAAISGVLDLQVQTAKGGGQDDRLFGPATLGEDEREQWRERMVGSQLHRSRMLVEELARLNDVLSEDERRPGPHGLGLQGRAIPIRPLRARSFSIHVSPAGHRGGAWSRVPGG